MRRRTKFVILAGSVVVLMVIAVAVLLGMANRILKAQLEKALGENFKVAHIGLSWGTVEADSVQMFKDGKITASAKKLGVRADFLTIFRKAPIVSALVLEEPAIHLVVDEQGNLISPFPDEEKKRPKGTTRCAIRKSLVFLPRQTDWDQEWHPHHPGSKIERTEQDRGEADKRTVRQFLLSPQ